MTGATAELARQLLQWHLRQSGGIEDEDDPHPAPPPARNPWDATRFLGKTAAIVARIEKDGPTASELKMLTRLDPEIRRLAAKVARVRRDTGIRIMRDHGVPARVIADAMNCTQHLIYQVLKQRPEPPAG